jgi:hypothetical protein
VGQRSLQQRPILEVNADVLLKISQRSNACCLGDRVWDGIHNTSLGGGNFINLWQGTNFTSLWRVERGTGGGVHA